MRAAATHRQVVHHGIPGRATFGISRSNEAHIMTILRDTLYSDKVMAVIREYASNAWDAHQQSGKGHIPIKVTLPTVMSPTLVIRDFGMGLSEQDVFQVYTQYGESTKRHTDDAVGMLGIGGKSAFCYSDTFTITSWHDGTKSIYVAVLDASDVGEIQKLHVEPCDPNEIGLEIQVPVKIADITEFHDKARGFFKYFNPLPDIHLATPMTPEDPANEDPFNSRRPLPDTTRFVLPQIERHVTPYGFIAENDRQWTAIMGCVPYRLDIYQIQKELEAEGLWDTIHRLKGAVYFNIGEVQVSASREDLKYSDFTKAAIAAKIPLLIDAYITDVLDTLAGKAGVTDWEKRQKAVFMSGTLKVPIPKRYGDWGRHAVPLWKDGGRPASFNLQVRGQWTPNIVVSPHTKLYLRDDKRAVNGYHINDDAVIVVPEDGCTLDTVRAELDTFLTNAQLTGIPIVTLSSQSWTAPYVHGRRRGAINPKHKVATFRLKPGSYFHDPYSDAWEIENREPTDADVFVILSGFQAEGYGRSFYSTYETDTRMAKLLKVEMPPIYGYKTTDKKPVKTEDIQGTPYATWRKTFFASLLTEDLRKLIDARHWTASFDDAHYSRRYGQGTVPATWAALNAALGSDHPMTEMYATQNEAVALLSNARQVEDLITFMARVAAHEVTPIVKLRIETAYTMYPLIRIQDNKLGVLGGDHQKEWIDYIQMMDRFWASQPHEVGRTDDTVETGLPVMKEGQHE